jgi:hypothetical protein
MLNADLTRAKMKQHIRNAFGNEPELVTLPPQFRLFKLTQHPLIDPGKDIDQKLSHWWSPVEPYLEDKLGALGRWKEAQLNEGTMREMVRFAAAVSLDWNDLTNYLEVVTLDHIQCFWGTHSPQPAISDNPDPAKCQHALEVFDQRGVYVPDTLGGIDTAYQFWIPDLTIEYVEERATLPAHDMRTLWAYLNVPRTQ